jgi:hypothetical protein
VPTGILTSNISACRPENRKVSGRQGDEATGCWRKLRNEEIHDF